jgi:hypothetical protein
MEPNDLRAPIPFDLYAARCTHRNDVTHELECLHNYANEIHLDEIIHFIHHSGWFGFSSNPLDLIDSDWQHESTNRYRFKKKIPPTIHPIVAYRGYTEGIIESGEVVTDIPVGIHDFGGRLRSLTLSQQFMNEFTKGKPPPVVHSRVDILNGIEVLPLFDYEGIDTEYEIVVKMGRLHVFPVTTVLEGQVKMTAVNKYGVETECELIDYFFVISKPGTVIDYNPTYQTHTMLGGGGLHLNDQNALGIGNVIDMMDGYIQSKDRIKNISKIQLPRYKPKPKIKSTRYGGKRKRRQTRRIK